MSGLTKSILGVLLLQSLLLAGDPRELEAAKAASKEARAAAVESAGGALRMKLRESYARAIDKELEVATKGGKLDEALALKAEREKSGQAEFVVPAKDPAGVPASLVKLRDIWRKEMTRIEKLEAAAGAVKDAEFAARLQKLETQLTKEKRLEDALAVRNARLGLAGAPAATGVQKVPTGVADGYPVPLVKPGRLCVAGLLKAAKPITIEAAAAHQDYVQVVCYAEDRWAALRATGEVITSGSFSHQNVAYMNGFSGTLALTLRDGQFATNSKAPECQPPSGSGPFRYVTVGYGPNFLGLQKDGKAVCWGKGYSEYEKPKRNRDVDRVPPPAEQLANVKAVAAGYQEDAVITANGDLLFWTVDGVMPKAKKAEKLKRLITGKHYNFLALTEKGELFSIDDESLKVKTEQEKVADACLNHASQSGYLWQGRNGEWHIGRSPVPNHASLLKVIKDMPAGQFSACFGKDDDDRTVTCPCWLVWIEPADGFAPRAVPEMKLD